LIGCSQGKRLLEVLPDSNARYWSDSGYTAHPGDEDNRALAADIAALVEWSGNGGAGQLRAG
jgi:hypothetical protein